MRHSRITMRRTVHSTLRHPLTGERLISEFMFDGRPVWPTMGAEDGGGAGGSAGGDGGGSGSGSGGSGGSGDGSGGSGSAGGEDVSGLKSALEKERTEAKTWKQKATENQAAADELAKIKEANASEQEKAVTQAKKDADAAARKEVTEQFTRRIVTAEVKAAAGGKLADPADAVRLLDLDSFELNDKLEVDSKKVDAAIEQLLKDKPYLAGKGQGGGKPSFDNGSRQSDGKGFGAAGLAEAERRFGKKTN